MHPPSFQPSQGDFVFSSLPGRHPQLKHRGPPSPSQRSQPRKKSPLTEAYDWLIYEHITGLNLLALRNKTHLKQLFHENLQSCSGWTIKALPSCRCAEFVKKLPWPQNCPLVDPHAMDSKSKTRFLEGVAAMRSSNGSGRRAAPDPTAVDFALTPNTQMEVLGSSLRAGVAAFEPSPGKPCPLLGLHKATLAPSTSQSRKRCQGQDAQTLAKRAKAQGDSDEGLDQSGVSQSEPSGQTSIWRETSHSDQRQEAKRQVLRALLQGEQYTQNLITSRFFALPGDNKEAFKNYLRVAVHDGGGPLSVLQDEIPPPVEYYLTRLLWTCKGEQKSLQLENAAKSLERYPLRDRDFVLTEEALGVLDALRSSSPSPQDHGDHRDAESSEPWSGPFVGGVEGLDGFPDGGVERIQGSSLDDYIGSLLNLSEGSEVFMVKGTFEEELNKTSFVIFYDGLFGGLKLLKSRIKTLRHTRPALADLLESLFAAKDELRVCEAVLKQLEAAEAERSLQKQNHMLRDLQAAHDIINQGRVRSKGGSKKSRHGSLWGPHGDVEESSSGSNSGSTGVPRRKRERRQ